MYVTLKYQHTETIEVIVNPETGEVTFAGKVVTGKMCAFFSSGEERCVEIFERCGRYYLEPAP